jgi:hypothetical protein
MKLIVVATMLITCVPVLSRRLLLLLGNLRPAWQRYKFETAARRALSPLRSR